MPILEQVNLNISEFRLIKSKPAIGNFATKKLISNIAFLVANKERKPKKLPLGLLIAVHADDVVGFYTSLFRQGRENCNCTRRFRTRRIMGAAYSHVLGQQFYGFFGELLFRSGNRLECSDRSASLRGGLAAEQFSSFLERFYEFGPLVCFELARGKRDLCGLIIVADYKRVHLRVETRPLQATVQNVNESCSEKGQAYKRRLFARKSAGYPRFHSKRR